VFQPGIEHPRDWSRHLTLTGKPAAGQTKLWWADRLRDLSETLA